MADITKIEWTGTYLKEPVMWKKEMTTFIPGATFNLVIGCSKVSPACKYCYAEAYDHRFGGGHWGPNTDRRQMAPKYWNAPYKWNKEAAEAGITRKVFCSSLADWCEDHPQLVLPRQRLFTMIEETPNLVWLLLTKRPENILRFIPDKWKMNPPRNVWYGTTIESEEYLWRAEELCKVPASIRFVSSEPLLGSLKGIGKYLGAPHFGWPGGGPIFSDRMGYAGRGKIHWLITGGESGDHKDIRPSHPDWFRELMEECLEHRTPFLFKQWGEYTEHMLTKATQLQSVVHNGFGQDMCRVGKKVAGRLLDGIEYNGMPEYILK